MLISLWKVSQSETVENEVKLLQGGFLGMLAAALGASLLGNMSFRSYSS